MAPSCRCTCYGTSHTLLQDGRPAPLAPTGDWEYQWRGMLTVGPAATRVELVRQQTVNPNPSTTGN